MEEFLVPEGDAFRLPEIDPSRTSGMDERTAARTLGRNRERIAGLQNVLYAEGSRALLVVLQSMDTGGKDPIIREVLQLANPQACRVTAFKKASRSEQKRDRFWRFHLEMPGKGEIGVFARWDYDETLRDHAHGEVDVAERERRYRQTNLFQRNAG